jgi:uncharacterized coiled-coil protein SlyX
VKATDTYAWCAAQAAPATQQPSITPCRARNALIFLWSEQNLVSSCPRCDFGDGRRVAVANTKATIARLRQIVEQQKQRIEMLLDRLAQLERVAQSQSQREPAQPAIY